MPILTNLNPVTAYTASVVTDGSILTNGLGTQLTSLQLTASFTSTSSFSSKASLANVATNVNGQTVVTNAITISQIVNNVIPLQINKVPGGPSAVPLIDITDSDGNDLLIIDTDGNIITYGSGGGGSDITAANFFGSLSGTASFATTASFITASNIKGGVTTTIFFPGGVSSVATMSFVNGILISAH